MLNKNQSPQIPVVLSCEHGGNFVPDEFQAQFSKASKVLDSHRGWDPGALELFFEMKKTDVEYSQFSETSRLLIDLNRSLHRRSLFSEFTRPLSTSEKNQIIDCFYHPFRNQFMSRVSSLIHEKGFVFHVSVHSFTPVLNGKKRNADVGLLYNPGFGREKELAVKWREMLNVAMPQLRVRMNYPYLGKNDGHVFPLRQKFGQECYAGIELEINQKYAFNEDFNRKMSGVFKEFLAVITA